MHDSLWSVTAQVDRRPALAEDIPVDVAIIGAGITGLTAARELSRRGKRVAVLEARAVGAGVTGGTTAHITEAIDTRYTTLEKDFGREGARLAAASSREALEHIRRVVAEEGISCGLEAVAGYLYTERREDTGAVEEELAAMERAGLRVSTTNDLPVPLRVCAALRLEDQGQFHALAYLAGLARAVEARGGAVWEGTRVLSVEETDEGCHVHTEAGPVVRAQHVVLATHAPLNAALLGTKVAQYRSYVIACPVAAAVPALLWDTADPYHYTRWCTVDGRVYLIVGGEDHKTGLGDATDAPFAASSDESVGEPAGLG
jgi:glycine/D-amino acid oxidase-like deaminating enzyme